MKSIFSRINESEIFRNSFILSTGTAISQIVLFFFTFIISRFYNEYQFGEFSLFQGISTILAVIAVGSYDKAIMFVYSQRRLRSLISLIFLMMSLVVVITCLGLLICHWLNAAGQIAAIGTGVYWVPLGIFAASAYQIFLFVSLRDGAVATLGWTKVVQSILTGGVQFFLAASVLVPGLIVGHIAGLAISLALLGFSLRKRGFRLYDLDPRIIMRTAKKYANYPKYTLPNELIDNASSQFQTIVIGAIFGLGALGQFAFSTRILSAPAALVGQAVGQSFFHSIRQEGQTNTVMLRTMVRIWLVLAALGAGPFLVLMIFGAEIFSFLFGSSWIGAGLTAQYMSPLLFARFVSSPTSSIYLKLNLQKQQLFFVILAFCYRIGSIYIAFLGYNFFDVVVLWSAIEICAIFAYNAVAVRVLKTT